MHLQSSTPILRNAPLLHASSVDPRNHEAHVRFSCAELVSELSVCKVYKPAVRTCCVIASVCQNACVYQSFLSVKTLVRARKA